jgi:hypothetical protein
MVRICSPRSDLCRLFSVSFSSFDFDFVFVLFAISTLALMDTLETQLHFNTIPNDFTTASCERSTEKKIFEERHGKVESLAKKKAFFACLKGEKELK